ncbi:MAG: hypothetical protein ACE5KO_00565 [Candidatus Bathyarchaeia archaeon]
MSWLIEELQSEFKARATSLQDLLDKKEDLEVFQEVARIAKNIAKKHGIDILLNFPLKAGFERPETYGCQNVSFYIDRGRKKLVNVTRQQLAIKIKEILPEAELKPTKYGYDGFRVELTAGRLDILPGALHAWCEITPRILMLLDWLFLTVYGLAPQKQA